MLELTRLVPQWHPRERRLMPLLLVSLLDRPQKHQRRPQSSTLRLPTWVLTRARHLDLLQILPPSARRRTTSSMPALFDKQIAIAPRRPAPHSRTTRCIASACSVLVTEPQLSPLVLKVAPPRAGSIVSARPCPVHASSPGSCARLGSRDRHRYALRTPIRRAYSYIRLLFWSMNRVRTG